MGFAPVCRKDIMYMSGGLGMSDNSVDFCISQKTCGVRKPKSRFAGSCNWQLSPYCELCMLKITDGFAFNAETKLKTKKLPPFSDFGPVV